MHLILVHIGPQFPDYINDCISQASRFIGIPIHVILPHQFIPLLSPGVIPHPIESLSSPYIDQFEQMSKLDSSFRNGFWKYATLRFFYIHAYAKKAGLNDIFHIEYDNLIYYDFAKKIDIFRQKDMWLVLDSPSRCIPSFMYFKNASALEHLLPQLIHTSSRGMNDMESLAKYYNTNKSKVGLLPIVINYPNIPQEYYENAFMFGCLFDGACVGQYIGGVDPRNTPGDTRGFINETSIFRCDRVNIEWKTVNSLNCPFLNNMPMVNLHIHSKELKRWSSTSNTPDLISGERLQNICDIYCGMREDFEFNPYILSQKSKHLDLSQLIQPFKNPFLVFCYGHRLQLLQSKIHLFQNKFVLITHNSDENITEQYRSLIDSPNIIRVYSQNVAFDHPKLSILPIGIANKMWPHGNMEVMQSVIRAGIQKTRDVYFYFDINTNFNKRSACKRALQGKGLIFGSPSNYADYLQTLAQYRFAICPEGNGLDSHRIWECLYLGVIPIMVANPFTIRLKSLYPCIVLNDWNEFTYSILDSYSQLSRHLECVKNTLTFSYYDHLIRNGTDFDIVIPVGPNEYSKMSTQIEYTRQNIIGYRHIYVVSNMNANRTRLPGCIHIDESIFPFKISTVAEYHGSRPRNGWYLQQLIKLYSSIIIPGIRENYLVLDADTYFLRPTSFFENGIILYNAGTENYDFYFNHMKRLHPSLQRVDPGLSGICHHMMFNRRFIMNLFTLVQQNHKGVEFWKVFLKEVDPTLYDLSGASEYEIYFNFMLIYNPRFMKVRPLRWINYPTIPNTPNIDYVSCHWYMT